jgi:WD40 repeat protein
LRQREGAAREWRLRCILTEPGTAITTLAWHPVRPQLLASSTSDLRVCVWCVVQQRIIASVDSPSEPSLLDWNPFERYVSAC